MKRILLLEDDKSLGTTLKERLEREGFDVRWVESLNKAALSLQSEGDYDLFILDVGLPDGSGFDFARTVRGKSKSPVIFVTAQSGAEDRLRGYELGADEYIPKPFHLKEFLLRVRHVMENHAQPHIYKIGDVLIDIQGLYIEKPGVRETLTKKEADVLDLLIRRSPKAVSRDELLNSVWGENEFPSNRTVDNVIVRLRQLLGDMVGAYIRSVRGVGYQWSEHVPEGE